MAGLKTLVRTSGRLQPRALLKQQIHAESEIRPIQNSNSAAFSLMCPPTRTREACGMLVLAARREVGGAVRLTIAAACAASAGIGGCNLIPPL